MRVSRSVLTLGALLLALFVSAPALADTCPIPSVVANELTTFPIAPLAAAMQAAERQEVSQGTCYISIQCDYGSPSYVSCSDANGNCSSGCDFQGRCWVQCGSNRTWCGNACGSDGVCNPLCEADFDCCDPCQPSCPQGCGGNSCDCVQGEPCATSADCGNDGVCKRGSCSCFC